FQAEDGIRYGHVTGVQTCALPISKISAGGRCASMIAATIGKSTGRASMIAATIGKSTGRASMIAATIGKSTGCASMIAATIGKRSEERRVGNEGRPKCRGEQEITV